jgi:hypothetical protein
MTREEFRNARFGNHDQVEYKGQYYNISSVDFEEDLFGIEMNIPGGDEGDITWIRCESSNVFLQFKKEE